GINCGRKSAEWRKNEPALPKPRPRIRNSSYLRRSGIKLTALLSDKSCRVPGGFFMAQDNNDGISYLLALRQSSRSQVSERPTDSEQGQQKIGSQEYAGTNRRREPRYLCVGSAEIREEGCEVRTWATFTDISLHGCYVEAQATYPAGTVLNLKLEANGIRVDTKGNVRVNYPYLGMEIAFVGMTEENVARLRQILANISRGCVVAGSG